MPHGTARLYQDVNQIVIRQRYRLFALSFRTLWPLKGLIALSPEGDALAVLCRKLTPWSSTYSPVSGLPSSSSGRQER